MFRPEDILYEDNHLLVVNKHTGDLVQPAPEGGPSLEEEIKAFIKRRDHKPGNVFLGVAHRIDRPVSGAVVMAKTSKALARLGEMIRERRIAKTYWAIVESLPAEREATLRHWLWRDGRTNITHVVAAPGERPGLAGAENGTASASAARPVGERDGERLRSIGREAAGARSTFPNPAKPSDDAKEAILSYKVLASSDNYHLLEVDLHTGRHHQIRAQLAAIGCPIRGDLKYGAARSLRGGGISLHSRRVAFTHPVSGQPIDITAPVPAGDNLWAYFETIVSQ